MSPINPAVCSQPPEPARRHLSSRLVATVLAFACVSGGVLAAAPAHAHPDGNGDHGDHGEIEGGGIEAGGRSTGDSLFPNVGNTGYDVEHYDIDLAYDHATRAIEATTVITAETTVRLSSFSLDFEGLTVESVLVDGEEAAFERVIDETATKFKLVISPDDPLEGVFQAEIAYSGVPKNRVDAAGIPEGWMTTPDGVAAVNQPLGSMTWFPNNNTPLDKATYDLDLTIPSEIDGGRAAAASTGELVAQTEDTAAGTTTWSWRQLVPMTTYVTLVSIGRFDVYESEVVLDASGRTIPEWSFIDPAIPAEHRDVALQARDQIGPILNRLESAYGRYPGNSTGMVFDAVDIGYAMETQDRPFYDYWVSEDLSSADLLTTIHELVHQWYGNAVTLADWSEIWLNEGPAEFLMIETDAALYGGPDTETVYFDQWNTIDTVLPGFWSAPLAGFTDPAALFSATTYVRGGMTFEALRLTIGDEALHEVLAEWYERFDGGAGSTAEFIALAEEIACVDLDDFFQDWLYDTDRPAWPAGDAGAPEVDEAA